MPALRPTRPVTVPPASLHALLVGSIDYAGLFPPAALTMRAAVERYAEHRRGDDSWVLGRFVLPASRLGEFWKARRALRENGPPWRVSALIAEDALGEAVARVRAFNEAHATSAIVDSVEGRAGSATSAARAIAALVDAVPRSFTLFVEIPTDGDVDSLVRAIADANACAKIRTGGVTSAMFPPPENVVAFLRSCAEHDVSFKATAGLHHPIRAAYRLTYEPDAPVGTMYGFLNVLLAAAFMRAGSSDDHVRDILTADHADAFQFDDAGVRWRNSVATTQQVIASRATFALSFGSCSFDEPVSELRPLGLL